MLDVENENLSVSDLIAVKFAIDDKTICELRYNTYRIYSGASIT